MVVVVKAANMSKMSKTVVKQVGLVSMCMLVVSNYDGCLAVQVNVVLLGVVVGVVVVVEVEV